MGAKEQHGEEVHTPAEGYKWNNLSGLYNSFYKQYGEYSLKEQQSMLNEAVNHLCEWLKPFQKRNYLKLIKDDGQNTSELACLEMGAY